MMEFLKNNFATIVTLVIPAGVIFLTGMLIWKSYSLSTIYSKFWGLFYGEKDYYNPDINKFAKTQHDTDKFNFVNGFKFDSEEKIISFLKHLEVNGYKIYWFGDLGKNFDYDTFSVKRPSKKDVWSYKAIMLVASIALIVWISSHQFTNVSNTSAFDIFANYVFSAEIAVVALIGWVVTRSHKKAIRTLDILNSLPAPPAP